MVPGVPPDVSAGLVRALAGGPLSAGAAGLALGMSKSAAHRHLAALHALGWSRKPGAQDGLRGGSWSAGVRRARSSTRPSRT